LVLVARAVDGEWAFDAEAARRMQRETAAKLGLPAEETLDLGEGVHIRLVLIPPGRFWMGSPATEADREKGGWGACAPENLHEVILTRPFYLGKTEVTQEQYQRLMGSNPSKSPDSKMPVETVTWEQSVAFCVKLGEVSKRVGRLPTEAEWEWACRAGSDKRFCLGDDLALLERIAWYGANSQGKRHPVGEKEPNAWGLHDMHGNVMEWVRDAWLRPSLYPEGPVTDPAGAPKGGHRIRRGGHYATRADRVRCAHRYYGNGSHTAGDMGFRCLIEIPSSGAAYPSVNQDKEKANDQR
jgi:formylglycine-generating enzyme required for sulfatase activity